MIELFWLAETLWEVLLWLSLSIRLSCFDTLFTLFVGVLVGVFACLINLPLTFEVVSILSSPLPVYFSASLEVYCFLEEFGSGVLLIAFPDLWDTLRGCSPTYAIFAGAYIFLWELDETPLPRCDWVALTWGDGWTFMRRVSLSSPTVIKALVFLKGFSASWWVSTLPIFSLLTTLGLD